MHEIGVEGIVARDEDGQRARAGPTRAAGLLPQRGQRARVAGEHDRVESGDVDPELQSVRRGHAQQPSAGEVPLDGSPVLGQVSRSVGGDASRQVAGVPGAQEPLRREGGDLRAPSGPDEDEGAGARRDQIRQDAGRLGAGRPVRGLAVLDAQGGERGFPQDEDAGWPGRLVHGDRAHRPSDQTRGRGGRFGHGRRREEEHRFRAVQGAHPSQPSEHMGDVGAEDSAVGMAFVDDHVSQPAQEGGPPVVSRQDAVMQHVGVGQHPVAVRADPVPLVRWGVAVVGARPHAGRSKGVQPAQLITGQRLGRRQVEDAGTIVGGDGAEAR